MDTALVVAAAAISITYLIEIDSVCLIDALNGDRARIMAQTLQAEIEFADLMGLPVPDTVDDPKCISTTGVWLVAIMGLSILTFLGYNIRVWGLPLVMVSIAVALYTIGTVLVWYFYGPDDINKYLVTKMGGEPRTFLDGIPNVHDALVNTASGMLGRFMNVIMNMVFPYIILGALFGKSAGGQTLIKLAFRWTRRLRGGPAHAAIVSSAMFGTITGGPVVNVLSTGVLTIPMMVKRGFSKVFAGGMEAAASSGGSIMPPVMGVAAFILAAMTAVPYRDIIIAATPSGHRLFHLPVHERQLSIPQARDHGRRRTNRGHAHHQRRRAAPVPDLPAHPADPVSAFDTQGRGRLRPNRCVAGRRGHDQRRSLHRHVPAVDHADIPERCRRRGCHWLVGRCLCLGAAVLGQIL